MKKMGILVVHPRSGEKRFKDTVEKERNESNRGKDPSAKLVEV